MKQSSAWLGVLAATLLVGCGGARKVARTSVDADGWTVVKVPVEGPGGERTVLVRYRGARLSWPESSASPGDRAWYDERRGATVYTDTSCGSRFDDAPLSALANHLTIGFTDVVIEDRREFELGERAALERTAAGKLDGVPVKLAITVLKKGPCVFDLVAIGPPDSWESVLAEYRAFRDGFEARVGR